MDQLGLVKGRCLVSQFTEISSLFEYEIRSAYAGSFHSLFETREVKILSYGYRNNLYFYHYGQLLLSSGPSDDVYLPRETTITSDTTFCISGNYHSAVFIGGDPPPNTRNMPIHFNVIFSILKEPKKIELISATFFFHNEDNC